MGFAKKFIIILFVLIGIVVVVVGLENLHNGNGSATPTDLSVKASDNFNGIEITNQESQNWDNCIVGINGSTGWGFDKPPYATRATALTITAGQTIIVPYAHLTAQDGSFFDRSTHAVNTIVVDCFRGSVSERSWVGTIK